MAYRHQGFALIFEYPDFRKRWVGSVVSALGTQAGWIALIWLMMGLTGHASVVGVVTLLYQLPQVVFGPVAGVVLDRYSRPAVMAAANFVLAAVFLAIPLAAHMGGAGAVGPIEGMIFVAGGGPPGGARGVPRGDGAGSGRRGAGPPWRRVTWLLARSGVV